MTLWFSCQNTLLQKPHASSCPSAPQSHFLLTDGSLPLLSGAQGCLPQQIVGGYIAGQYSSPSGSLLLTANTTIDFFLIASFLYFFFLSSYNPVCSKNLICILVYVMCPRLSHYSVSIRNQRTVQFRLCCERMQCYDTYFCLLE